MKKILFLLLFSYINLFSESWTDCCYDGAYPIGYTQSQETSSSHVKDSYYYEAGRYTINTYASRDWQSKPIGCNDSEQWVFYNYGNVVREGNPWVEYVDLYTSYYDVDCVCDTPDSESPTTPPFLNKTIFTFEGRGAISPGCNVGVDTEIFNAWNLLPSEDRYLGSITVNCCTRQTLYVKSEPCPSGQHYLDDGETCVDNFTCYAYNPLFIPQDGYNTSELCQALVNGIDYDAGHFDGGSSTCCVRPILPPNDCDLVGAYWIYDSSPTELECSSKVDGSNYISSVFLQDSSTNDTCCLKEHVTLPNDDDDNENSTTVQNDDGTIIKETNTTNPNGSVTNEVLTTNPNGSSVRTSVTTNPNGSTTTNSTSTNPNGSSTTTSTNSNDGNGTSYDSSSTDGILKEFASRNHDDLGEIKDTLSDIDDALSSENDVKLEGLEGLSTVLDNGIGGITSRFSSIVSYNLGVAPTFSDSNDNCNYSLSISYGNFDFPLSDTLDIVRPYLDGLWSFLFIYISFIMYFKGFSLVVNLL